MEYTLERYQDLRTVTSNHSINAGLVNWFLIDGCIVIDNEYMLTVMLTPFMLSKILLLKRGEEFNLTGCYITALTKYNLQVRVRNGSNIDIGSYTGKLSKWLEELLAEPTAVSEKPLTTNWNNGISAKIRDKLYLEDLVFICQN